MAHKFYRTDITNLELWKHGVGKSLVRKPMLVFGARQVGKTRLLKSFGAQHYDTVHYFNLEEDPASRAVFRDVGLSPQQLIARLGLVANTTINTARDLLILDEIQACPEALTSLKYFCEEFYERGEQIHLCASGSLLGLQLSTGSFPVGKVEMLELFPMSFFEFLLALGRDDLVAELKSHNLENPLSETLHILTWSYWQVFLVVGGLPGVIAAYLNASQMPTNTRGPSIFNDHLLEVRRQQEIVINSYHSDVAKHSGKINSLQIIRVFNAIPAQLMRSVDAEESSQRFKFKDVVPGVSGYAKLSSAIDWLIAARLIHRVGIANRGESPVQAFTSENIFKLYMLDVGILGAVVNLPPARLIAYNFGTYKGAVVEQFVLQELLAAGLRKPTSWQEGNSEIEFLIEGSSGIVPLEVKSATRVQAKSLQSFESRYHPEKTVVLSGRIGGREPIKKRLHLPVYLAAQVLDWSR